MSDTSGSWSEIKIAGHPCHCFEPKVPSPHGFVVVYLHGVHLGRLSDHPPFAEQFDRQGLRCLCPVTQRSWWTDRTCQEFDPQLTAERHVLDNVVDYANQRWDAKPPQLAILGSSMGGQGALRLAYKHPDVFPTVGALSPAIDYYLRMVGTDSSDPIYGTLHQMYRDPEDARQDSATLRIHPLNWPRNQFFACDPTDDWHESADRLRMKLSSMGIPHECDLETEGGGHGFGYYNAMAERTIDWIARKLEEERLRLPTAKFH